MRLDGVAANARENGEWATAAAEEQDRRGRQHRRRDRQHRRRAGGVATAGAKVEDRLWYMEVAAAGFGALLVAAALCVCLLLALRASTQLRHDRLMTEAKVCLCPGAHGWQQCMLSRWLVAAIAPPTLASCSVCRCIGCRCIRCRSHRATHLPACVIAHAQNPEPLLLRQCRRQPLPCICWTSAAVSSSAAHPAALEHTQPWS